MYTMEMGHGVRDNFGRHIPTTDATINEDLEKLARDYGNTDIYITPVVKVDGTDDVLGDMIIDIDIDGADKDEDAYNAVRDETIATCRWIHRNLAISISDLTIEFSGSKGYHIYVPMVDVAGIKPSKDLVDIYRYLGNKIKAEVAPNLDMSMYQPNRLFRIQNSINSKSGLYCVPVAFSELMSSSLELIQEWASSPREVPVGSCRRNPFAMAKMINIIKSDKWVEFKKEKPPVAKKKTSNKAVIIEDNERIDAIRRLDASYFQQSMRQLGINLSVSDAKNYAKRKINMATFLGLGYHCNCVLHDDATMSASILPGTASKDWIYYCHSSNCDYSNRSLDLIGVVQALANCDFLRALQFLAACSGINIPEIHTDGPDGGSHAALPAGTHVDNVIYATFGALKTLQSNPARSRKIAALVSTAEVLCDEARKKASIIDMADHGEYVYFSASTRYIAEKTKQDQKDVVRKINLLATLGLVEKVPDDQLPASIALKCSELDRQCMDMYDGRTIQYFRLRLLSPAEMVEARDRLDLWIDVHGTIKMVTAANIAAVYGTDIAAMVFVKPAAVKIAEGLAAAEEYVYVG